MATKRNFAYLIAKFVTNTVRAISGLDVGDLVTSMATRTGVLQHTSASTNYAAGVNTKLVCTITALNPATGGMSLSNSGVRLPLAGLYMCHYNYGGISSGAGIFRFSLWDSTTELPGSAIGLETAGGDSFAQSGSYLVYAPTDNYDVFLYMKTTANETVTNVAAYAVFLSVGVIET
jgi:hypothetical protein